jgi:uncharacterized protein YdhG (YjbR/CyaY superfamily)
MTKEVKSVPEYIAMAPKWAQPILRELRKTIKASAPDAQESISYHIPYYSQNGRLGYFAAYKNHCSFHWISAEDKKNFAKELANLKVVNTTLHISHGDKVPTTLIKKIIRARVKRNEVPKKK